MNRSTSLTSALLGLLVVGSFQPAATPINHVGLSAYDNVLLCARKALGKPVIGFEDWPRIDDVPCGDAAAMRTAFAQKKLRILDLGDWLYLIPEERFAHPSPSNLFQPIEWKRLKAETAIRHFPLMPGSRRLTGDEEAAVSKAVLSAMRTVPRSIHWTADQTPDGPPSPDGETAVLLVTLWLDAHRLGPSVPESIIAVLANGIYGDYGRLAYGEIRNGKFEMLWDSPMFAAWNLGLGYNDVDGDGVEEILVSNSAGRTLGSAVSLAIFTRQGIELTRQRPCTSGIASPIFGGDAGAMCPIRGAHITIAPPRAGKKDLLVDEEEERGKTVRYRLMNGRYVEVPDSQSVPVQKKKR